VRVVFSLAFFGSPGDLRPPSYIELVADENTPRLIETLSRFVPHNQALGIRYVSSSGGRVTLALPYDAKLVGNPETGVLHGGAITAVLDAACSLAVFAKLGEPLPIATLDLRIDYLRPASAGKEVHARAECFRVTKSIAFVRCDAFHEGSEADAVAVANGTFIVFRGKAPAKVAAS
jgi:uncharacterized protein (TIGR00369 family)